MSQHIRQAALLAGDARQPQAQSGAGPRAMPQPQFQSLHARLPFAQESRAAPHQRFERLEQIRDGLDLRLEIAALAKTLTPHERPARRGLPRQRDIEIEHRGRSRNGAPDRRAADAAIHPPGSRPWRARSASRSASQPVQARGSCASAPASEPESSMSTRLAGAGEPQRRQSRWSVALWAHSLQPAPSGIDAGMQPFERAEQLHAAVDLQQQGIGHFDADQRSELLRMQAETLQRGGGLLRLVQRRKHHGVPQAVLSAIGLRLQGAAALRTRSAAAPESRLRHRPSRHRPSRQINPPWRMSPHAIS